MSLMLSILSVAVIEAGCPDEDELYESAIIDTNMVYELKDKQLIPYEKFWSTIPKIEMLDKNKVIAPDKNNYDNN
jgi:supervillin